jgi:hypothetical protein
MKRSKKMKKKLSLEKTWIECLKMWKWIVEQIKKDPNIGVITLKSEWLVKNKYKGLEGNCFFCDYDQSTIDSNGGIYNIKICKYCPGRLVNRKFNCEYTSYDWYDKPIAFYKKLLELNRIRKSKKIKKMKGKV